VEADKFLVGAVEPKDFEKHRLKVVRALRELQQRSLKTAAEQFRLSSLEARFNSMSEMYGRRIRDREEGRGVRPPAPAAAAPAHDPERGIRLGRDLEPASVEALLAGLVRGGGAAPDLGSFRTYLGRQLEALEAKTGATAATFRLAVEDGKLKLKVRPVGGGG
jgi:hypothetical protein